MIFVLSVLLVMDEDRVPLQLVVVTMELIVMELINGPVQDVLTKITALLIVVQAILFVLPLLQDQVVTATSVMDQLGQQLALVELMFVPGTAKTVELVRLTVLQELLLAHAQLGTLELLVLLQFATVSTVTMEHVL